MVREGPAGEGCSVLSIFAGRGKETSCSSSGLLLVKFSEPCEMSVSWYLSVSVRAAEYCGGVRCVDVVCFTTVCEEVVCGIGCVDVGDWDAGKVGVG